MKNVFLKIRYWLDPGAEPSLAQQKAREWERARRERQLAPFVVDRSSLFTHGID